MWILQTACKLILSHLVEAFTKEVAVEDTEEPVDRHKGHDHQGDADVAKEEEGRVPGGHTRPTNRSDRIYVHFGMTKSF